MKRLLSLLLAVLFLASASVALAADTIDLEFWIISSRKEITESLVADFMAVNPDITVTPVIQATLDHRRNLMVAASSQTMPDAWFIWGGTIGGFYSENGLSYDLADYAAAHNWDEKFSAAALNLSTLNGQLAGYPAAMNAIGVFYRKDIFEANGIAVPTTFEEFEQACATLKAVGIVPIGTGGLGGYHVMRLTEALIEMYAGSELHDKLNSLEEPWTNEAVVKAFTKLKEFSDLGYFPEGYVTQDPEAAKMLLYAGMTAMQIEGQYMESNFVADEQDRDLYGYFKLPLSEEGNRMSAFVEMWQFNKNLTDEELEAALKFADFYFSPESVAKYGAKLKQPIPRTDNILPADFRFVPLVLADADEYGTFTIGDQALVPEVAALLFAAQDNIGLGLEDPATAAATMQAGIEAYLANK